MDGNNIIIPEYQKEDYLTSSAPFEWLYQFKDNKLKMQQFMNLLRDKAWAVGVKNFVTLFKAYLETINTKNGTIATNVTDFTDQIVELDCGEWYADDNGITSIDKMGFTVIACNHPVLPVQRLINVDNGIEKLKIMYRKSKQWRSIIADKKTLASNTAILQLADYGIAVNSENSKYLVRYLTDVEHLNYDRIEELNSVGRLGWIDEYGFSPYVENLVFDGEISFKHFFESVKEHGNYEKWLDIAKTIRKNGTLARIMLASSFSSVLVKPCEALPFFVHLWGGTEAGKTVALMLAASVWANPEMGKYVHTFNGTAIAQELSAGFVNSLPLILDELQIIKDRKDFDSMIYLLSEGIGRGRGAKLGGLQKINSWQNCIMTTGEMPISNSSSGGGAVNRIIEIDCKNEKLFSDPINVVEVIKHNYGFAGKIFVEKLQGNIDYAVKIQKYYYKKLTSFDTTEKQAMAASMILTADFLITKWIFEDEQCLTIEDMQPYLSTLKEVSVNERALSFIFDYISINSNKFKNSKNDDYKGEIWGCEADDCVYIIKSQFDKIMQDAGYNSTAFLSWAKHNEYIMCDKDRTTKKKRIQDFSVPPWCVCFKKTNEIKKDQDNIFDNVKFENTNEKEIEHIFPQCTLHTQ